MLELLAHVYSSYRRGSGGRRELFKQNVSHLAAARGRGEVGSQKTLPLKAFTPPHPNPNVSRGPTTAAWEKTQHSRPERPEGSGSLSVRRKGKPGPARMWSQNFEGIQFVRGETTDLRGRNGKLEPKEEQL